MKIRFIILLILSSFLFSGCEMTSAERVETAREGFRKAQTVSAEAEATIPLLEESIAQARLLVASTSNEEERINLIRFIDGAEEALIKTTKAKVLADEYIHTMLQSSCHNELEFIGTGVGSLSRILPPPWNVYAGIAGSLIAIAGGLLGKRVGDKTAKKIIQSVDSGLDILSDESAASMKTAMKGSQTSSGIRLKVLKMKGLG